MENRFLVFFLLGLQCISCQTKEARHYLEQLPIPQERYKKTVLIIDTGCHTCKHHFYEYVLNDWPDSTALVIRRGIRDETQMQYPEIHDLDFFYHDSLDRAFEIGLAEKNTEMALIKNGRISHYNFLQYNELITELEIN